VNATVAKLTQNLQTWQVDAAGVALVLVMSAAAYFGWIGPLLARRDAAAAQSAELAGLQTQARDADRVLHAMRDRLAATRGALESKSLQLEPPTQLNARLARLSELAAARGVQIDSMESGLPVMQPRYGSVTIRIGGRGSYRACGELVRAVRSEMPDVAVTSLELDAGAGKSGADATLVTELRWYTAAKAVASGN
jgi:Tfp pilus assembly protein PilO